MNPVPIQLIVLDAHGVIFNNPFIGFLADVARMTDQTREDVVERWYRDLRTPAWTGAISDDEIWHSLTGSQGDPECWQALLETHYALGPVAPMLKVWSQTVPLWILSNHRTHWLHRRLKRFGIFDLFERVIVSDDLKLIKPDDRLFEFAASQTPAKEQSLFIDDQTRNVEAAARAGFMSVSVNSYIKTVSQLGSVAGPLAAPMSDLHM